MIDWDGVNRVACTLVALAWVAAIISWAAWSLVNYPVVTATYHALWLLGNALKVWGDETLGGLE